MAEDLDRLVPMAAVRNADLRVAPAGLSFPGPQRIARVAELRRRALDGYYASESMMEVVARRLFDSGDL